MSRYVSNRNHKLHPYVPGEQPKNMDYVKLNTNESPYKPSKYVQEVVSLECNSLMLYSDPECKSLREVIGTYYGVNEKQILIGNGSDEILSFIFLAYGDKEKPFVFPDITYGFYPVYSKLYHIPYEEVPLSGDYKIRKEDYVSIHKNIVIANPNAPTGIYLSMKDMEEIIASNPDNMVIIDEAYIDFGGESAVKLIDRYENLLIVQTFSKSRSMAGARLGFAIGNEALIHDLDTIRNSINPYNVNRLTLVAGIAAIQDETYFRENCNKIIETREWFKKKLLEFGFDVLESKANFIFVSHPKISGKVLYTELKARGILVRHFEKVRLTEHLRITIGSREQMERCFEAIKEIIIESGLG